MKIISSALTDVGKIRELNEDYFVIKGETSPSTSKFGKSYIICDGMGGHQAGEIASKIAAEEFLKNYYSEELKEADTIKRIRISIELTNKKIYDIAKNNPSVQGMGTTIVGLIVKSKKVFVFNVGDSRCYLMRKGKIEQLTEDHSLVNELVKAKIMNEEDAKTSSKRNVLTRAIGTDEKVEPFIREINSTSGTKFLLCTDGLSNMVKENEIKHIVSENEPKNAVEKLVALANERGGPDNITAIEVAVSISKKKKFLIFGSIAAIVSICTLLLLSRLSVTRILINTIPSDATILINGKEVGKSPFKLPFRENNLTVKLSKEGFKEEYIEISRNGVNLFYKTENQENEIKNNAINIDLEKIVMFKIFDSSSNIETKDVELLIDGKVANDYSKVPLSIGNHSLELRKDLYTPLSKEISIGEETNEISLSIQPIELFTLDSSPQGAIILLYDPELNTFVKLKDKNGQDIKTPFNLDFNEIKNKRIRLIKDENNSIVYFAEFTLKSDSDIPPRKYLTKYFKVNIESDVNNTKFSTVDGKPLIKVGSNTYLIKYPLSFPVNVKGESVYGEFKIIIEKALNESDMGRDLTFNFRILNITDKSVELADKQSFDGVINNEIHFNLNILNKTFNLSNIKINNISGYDDEGYKYEYSKKG